MPEWLVISALAALLLVAYVLFGVLALSRCERQDVRKVLRTLIHRGKR